MKQLETHPVIIDRVATQVNRLGRGIDYIEVGANCGNSVRAVLETGMCRRAVIVDNWCYETASKEKTEEAIAKYKHKVQIISGDSKDVLPLIVEQFDIGYVDGDHSEAGCIADMTNMLSLIREGGIMFVDDLDHHAFPFLNAVVRKFALERKLNMIFHASHQGLAEILL